MFPDDICRDGGENTLTREYNSRRVDRRRAGASTNVKVRRVRSCSLFVMLVGFPLPPVFDRWREVRGVEEEEEGGESVEG